MEEHARRRRALAAIGFMILIWIALSSFSFVAERGQVLPQQVSFNGVDAVEGKRVFQAYNCMGCHTIVGNGAYFAPDLTDEYEKTGPAWLAAFLASAGTWPTEAALKVQLQRMASSGLVESADLETYYRLYPGARSRVNDRGGRPSLMPNLRFRAGEIDALIAFLRYTSSLDTEGWPPVPEADPVRVEQVRARLRGAAIPGPGDLAPSQAAPAPEPLPPSAAVPPADRTPSASAPSQAAVAPSPSSPPEPSEEELARMGRQASIRLGCSACHSTDGSTLVGPTWKGLYGKTETLEGGQQVVVDDAYLRESILRPQAAIVKGFPNIMPPFEGVVSEDDLKALMAYIKSLR